MRRMKREREEVPGWIDRLIVCLLPWVPRPLVRRFAYRYIAGDRRQAALEAVRALASRGLGATVSLLGEACFEESQARAAVEEYLGLLDELKNVSPAAHISVKPTHVGLKIDQGTAEEGLARLVESASQQGGFVRIDMEDSSTTEATLAAYRRLREKWACVGIVLQANLKRSIEDLQTLLPLEPNVRICKGAYLEPPEISHRSQSAIREAYLELLDLQLGGSGWTAVATHDEAMVERAVDLLPPERGEFQMLYGVGQGLQQRILDAGHRMRIYVPYGQEWYRYCLRRFRENPRIAGQVFRGLLSRR